MERRILIAGLWFAVMVGSQSAFPQPFPEQALPPVLEPWVPWVLDGQEDKLCPLSADGSTVCLWPKRLTLSALSTEGRFRLEVFADRAVYLPLPGSYKLWPQEVHIDGQRAAVLQVGSQPAVWIQKGNHAVNGRFHWSQLPASLPVPPTVALIDLSVGGRAIDFPRRERDGNLYLREAEPIDSAEERLDLKVFRQLRDGIPWWIETVVQLEVSGRAREVRLQGALLPAAVPVSVGGQLPARLDTDGSLRIQVRAGRYQVRFLSRLRGRPTQFGPSPASEPWPQQEYWAFVANTRLRQVQIGGAPAIDPARAETPESWRGYPTFALSSEARLWIKEVQRGEPQPPPDAIRLHRTLWLDQSGDAFSVRDQFVGRASRSSRLDMVEPGKLGRVALDGADQVLTTDPTEPGTGVELRKTELQMEADSRLPRGGALPAVGWDVRVESLHATLNLPPGWVLLSAFGVDRAAGSWTEHWTLFSFFFVLLAALAAAKLLDWRWGLATLITLALCHGEVGAPEMVWLFLLAAMALLKVAPRGILQTLGQLVWILSALVLVLILLPFWVDQMRGGLFPQLGELYFVDLSSTGAMMDKAPAAPPPSSSEAELQSRIRGALPGGVPEGVVGGAPSEGFPQTKDEVAAARERLLQERKAKLITEQPPHAIVQTGAGMPNWSWKSHALVWSGPVAPTQTVRLWLLTPGANLLLVLARVILTLLLAVRLLGEAYRNRMHWFASTFRNRAAPETAAVVAFALSGPFWIGTVAEAQQQNASLSSESGLIPSNELLGELRERLLRKPACWPNCLTTDNLQLVVEGFELRVEADVSAGAAGAWTIPGPVGSWVPASVSVDGQSAQGIALAANRFLQVRVAQGVHRIVARGPLPRRDHHTLQFADPPRRVSSRTPGWRVDGIGEDGAVGGSVELTRLIASQPSPESASEVHYQPWLEITRRFEIGVSWNATTIIHRVSPIGTPVIVKVPLPKELSLTDSSFAVEDGMVVVQLEKDQIEARFAASMEPKEGEIRLLAPTGQPWSEVWELVCSPVWQCQVDGLAPVSYASDGQLAPEFRPWPGEQLKLLLRMPAAVEGPTLTLDSVSLEVAPGRRLTDLTLALQARASRTGSLTVSLPAAAEIRELKVADQDQPIRMDGRQLKLTVDPGRSPIRVAWQQPGGIGLFYRLPEIGLGQSAVNSRTSITVPEQRWLLLTGGPSWGPAVLFWGYFIIVVAIAVLLGRLPASPLSKLQWFLLALGLSQIPVAAALIVAGWFIVLTWRRNLEPGRLHNLVQVVLALWTVAALVCLYIAVHQGLLLRPDMQVGGAGSTNTQLHWYVDWTDSTLPRPWVLSLPLWFYRLVMLAWALWLALSLIRWLQWGWESFSAGAIWLRRRPATTTPPGSHS